MRFLKNKIAQSQAALTQKAQNTHIILSKQIEVDETFQPSNAKHNKRNRIPGDPLTSLKTLETKNVVQNYARAIYKFNSSSLALPYIRRFIHEAGEGVSFENYIKFVNRAKGFVHGLSHFRSFLLMQEDDDKQTLIYKNIFKKVCEVFIKYFSVNWIYSSKLIYKSVHLKFRFKMLRRIKYPELFTYLKS